MQPLYGLAISLWGSVVLRAWRRQRCQLAALWGVDGAHETEVVRADFRGERVVSRVTGEATLYYPPWKRALKRCVTQQVLVARAYYPLSTHLLMTTHDALRTPLQVRHRAHPRGTAPATHRYHRDAIYSVA